MRFNVKQFESIYYWIPQPKLVSMFICAKNEHGNVVINMIISYELNETINTGYVRNQYCQPKR